MAPLVYHHHTGTTYICLKLKKYFIALYFDAEIFEILYCGLYLIVILMYKISYAKKPSEE